MLGVGMGVALCAGCADLGYVGAARNLAPEALRSEQGWLAVRGVPFVRQQGKHDCGPAALEMVERYWYPDRPPAGDADSGVRTSAAELRERAQQDGLDAFVIEGGFDDIQYELARQRPVIAGVAKPTVQGRLAHYEVVVGLHVGARRIATLDPARGLRQNTLEGFAREWVAAGRLLIVALPRTGAARSCCPAHGSYRYSRRRLPDRVARVPAAFSTGARTWMPSS
jgi:hypothetical protein